MKKLLLSFCLLSFCSFALGMDLNPEKFKYSAAERKQYIQIQIDVLTKRASEKIKNPSILQYEIQCLRRKMGYTVLEKTDTTIIIIIKSGCEIERLKRFSYDGDLRQYSNPANPRSINFS